MGSRRRTQSSRIDRTSSKPKHNHRSTQPGNPKQRHRIHQRKPLHSHPLRAPKITSRTAEKDVEHIEIDLSGSGFVLSGRRRTRRMGR